jgi:hypothetical protein
MVQTIGGARITRAYYPALCPLPLYYLTASFGIALTGYGKLVRSVNQNRITSCRAKHSSRSRT